MRLAFVLAVLLASPLTFAAPRAAAQPQLPSTVFGSVSVDGKPVPDNTEVRGFIDGKDCTQVAGFRGTVTDAGVSAYVITVMHESQRAGCGAEGKTITFTIAGKPAAQTTEWKVGLQQVDLNAGSGQPIALPSVTPAPATSPAPGAATPAIAPTGPPPTDDVTFNRTTVPTGTGGAPPQTNRDGAPVGLILLAALVVIAIAGAAAGIALSRR